MWSSVEKCILETLNCDEIIYQFSKMKIRKKLNFKTIIDDYNLIYN